MKYLIYTLVLSFSFNSFALLDASQSEQDLIVIESQETSKLQSIEDIESIFNYEPTQKEILAATSYDALCRLYIRADRIPRAWNSTEMRADFVHFYESSIKKCIAQLSQ